MFMGSYYVLTFVNVFRYLRVFLCVFDFVVVFERNLTNITDMFHLLIIRLLLHIEPSGSHPKKGESARWKTGGSHS
jgi:hypothetical protein